MEVKDYPGSDLLGEPVMGGGEAGPAPHILQLERTLFSRPPLPRLFHKLKCSDIYETQEAKPVFQRNVKKTYGGQALERVANVYKNLQKAMGAIPPKNTFMQTYNILHLISGSPQIPESMAFDLLIKFT